MTSTIFQNGRCQAVRLPKALRLPGKRVSIRKLGNGVYIEPITETLWPEDYFIAIQIDDDAFVRPAQGATPPSPTLAQ